jgi:NADH:ubiquinone oxidoreductase subunit B-like Fe-S oxidoreductase
VPVDIYVPSCSPTAEALVGAPAFDEHRIAELMRPVGVRAEGHGDLM